MILQPGDIVLDYSYSRPDPAAMKAAGVKAVCRYLSAKSNAKNLTASERDQLHAANLGILLVFEEAASSPLQGAATGVAHGAAARAMARALGYPESVPLIVAAQDMSLTQAQWPVVADYVKAFRTAAGWDVVYAYCGTLLGNYLANAGLIQGIWKAAAGSWSTGGNDAAVVVEQLYGYVHPGIAGLGSVDDNTVRKPLTVWDGHETKEEPVAYLFKRANDPEIDVSDGVWRTSVGSLAVYNEWLAILKVAGPTIVSDEFWNRLLVYTPPVTAASVPTVTIPTKITLTGSLS